MDTCLFSGATDLGEPQDTAQSPPMLDAPGRAMASLERVLLAQHPCQLQYSSGKDSSACANLLFNAAINIMAKGHPCPPIHVCHADTGVENPVVRALADAELYRMRQFASEHGIPVRTHIGRPTLGASYATRVLGGRALPPLPLGVRDCTSDWKILPSERITRKVMNEAHASGVALVTIIGTRSSESIARRINTAKRGESATGVWFGSKGQAMLSPILDWSTDDVWQYLGECGAGLRKSYSDFQQLIEFYSGAAGGECVVVAELKPASTSACGARSGCFVCGAVQNDHSVENMIASHPERYAYLVPLLRFRDYVVKTQWDWSLRNFLGRTIDADGYMPVKADQYSPAMCESLLRFMLAAQDEANRLGSPSRVCAVGLRELFAIDFYWSVRAWHPPFHALWVYLDHQAGNVQHAPVVSVPLRPSQVPDIGRVLVGRGWDSDTHPMSPPGLRSPVWEMFSDSCGPSLRSSPKGKVFLALEEAPELDVDEEGASLFLDFEAEEAIRRYHRPEVDWTIGASTHLRYGALTLAKGQSSTINNMMRRSQWLQRHDLHGHRTAEELRQRCQSLHTTSQVELFA